MPTHHCNSYNSVFLVISAISATLATLAILERAESCRVAELQRLAGQGRYASRATSPPAAPINESR